jgi:glycosyltransferase involved in cell wall biosynthesis
MQAAPGDHGEGRASSGEFVSIVVCFLNAERFLDEAIASIFAQSYRDWELLLVDDGSTDASTEIARCHAAENPGRVRYLEHPGHENRGVSAARNLGIAAAQGGLIAFLDADDVYLPGRLARSVELLRAHPSADMVYGESEYWHSWQGGQAALPDRIQPHGFRAGRVVSSPELLIRYLVHSAALPALNSITVRREAAQACGGFVESFRGMYEDQAFLARFCLHHDVFVAHECWDRYRQHEEGLCAGAARSGQLDQWRRAYLAWLRELLAEQGMQGTRVWEALLYAEAIDGRLGAGLGARIARHALRALTRLKMAVRPDVRPSGGR